jgi:hypothetical protein
MNSIEISVLGFSLLFGGALLGLHFSPFLSASELKEDTKLNLRTGVGLLTSMFALLLSLQLSSAKTSFDIQEQDVALLASKAVMLDRILAHYGPEAQKARESLRDNLIDLLNHVWPKNRLEGPTWAPENNGGIEFYNRIQELSPKDENQRAGRVLALGMAIELGQMRWKSASRVRSSTAVPLFFVEVAWATIIFATFGLLAPRNIVVVVSLAICASAVSGGFFLIVELNRPFSGLLHASGAPLREALKYLAR